ncbi:putative aspartic peptidase, active, aspartic peptidase domain superfamily [Helianthus anomalus]
MQNSKICQLWGPKRIGATTTTSATPSDNKRKWDGDSSKGSTIVQSQAQQRKTDDYQSPGHQSSGSQGRVDIGEITQSVIDATDTTVNQNQNRNQGNGNNNGSNNGGNNDGNGARGRVFVLGQGEARNDPNVVMGKFLLDDFYVTVLFDSGADTTYVSLKVSQMLKRTPTLLNTKHVVELANGRSLEATHIAQGCNLVLAGQPFSIDLIPIALGSFDIAIGMDWLSQ